jgi:D-lactate dehydrogenase
LHFIITPNLSQNGEFENFSNLVEDMSKMVSSFGGSIKAEHGTGRMVAPFVELEWGAKA